MKKTFILSLAFAALSLGGVYSAQAQTTTHFEAPAMQADVQAMADEVISNQLTDPDAANKTFSKLLKKVKSDKEQLVAVGKFFLDKQIYPCAKQCAQQVYTLDPAYIPGLMLGGHVAMLRKDWGGAGQKFVEILNYQPDNIEALRLNARVYKYVNPLVAKETLEKIIAKEPNNKEAYKELGDIAYNAEEYKDAVSAYKNFFDRTPDLTLNDLRAGENYLLSLMNQKDPFTIKDMAEKLLPLDPKDLVVRRMLFFSQMDTQDYQHAVEGIKYLTEKQYDDSLYLYLDYVYAASFAQDALEDKGQAIEYYKKAIEKDATKAEAYKRLAHLYRQNGQAVEAIPVYEKYLELLGAKADAAEKFGLASIYIAAKDQSKDEADRMKYIQAGDKIFEEYMAEQPTKYQGPFYRAQLWITDPQKAEEKPHEYYKQAIALIGDNADYAAQKKMALQYLMIYYFKNNDDASTKQYVNQILAIDPADKLANQVKGVLK